LAVILMLIKARQNVIYGACLNQIRRRNYDD
jgi:hypothetical protein